MNNKTTWIGFGIVSILIVILSIVFIGNSGNKDNFNEPLRVNVLSFEKTTDGSMHVTAEIVNTGKHTFEDNKIFISESTEKVGTLATQTDPSKNEGYGISTSHDKPQNIDEKELGDAFNSSTH
ncbi:hypothetical protein [Paenibacillus macquariensis]|uniref:DUF4352 domain-containing protein n=1 Tax=Paenibacillus macquariensis TaxID=948756 RepID=A0ABY1JP64_9BACL|nr:hypothetical protein [Paenibacillus macquariensis]MEC0092037.1 hypothetical protein [Paenibacillus macquariensis]OAB37392.1 hypothetical protein PMSM_04830 [Paenibacillus macquariensis subsp. macquariensis]SIQ52250.1 hypothetical protein SAMN05421578_102396 [Paenibacillus macquariensis]